MSHIILIANYHTHFINKCHSAFRQYSLLNLLVTFVLLLGFMVAPAIAAPPGTDTGGGKVGNALLWKQIEQDGSTRVVIGLSTKPAAVQLVAPHSVAGAAARRLLVGQAQGQLLSQLDPANIARVRTMNYLPYVAMEVNAAALANLEKNPNVTSISPDVLYKPTLAESSPLIGADVAWAAGFSGSGEVIAILDTGVDKFHPFLTGKVVSEACYSTTSAINGSVAVCASGSTAPGSGVPCPSLCSHGTHVAGIAAGNGPGAGVGYSGVARDASLAAIQVFSQFTTTAVCGPVVPCMRAYLSDITAGIDRVYELKTTLGFNMASANLSLGGGSYSDQAACDAAYPPMTDAITLLRSAGVASTISSGNSGLSTAMGHPGCISTAISVGATTKADIVASYSNSSPLLELLAPGSSILSSVPGGGYSFFSGTSMAAPQVAGAWAVLKDKTPAASVTEVLTALQDTGVPITDPRNGLVRSRIQVDAALAVGTTPLVIDTTTLPDANVGEVYSQTVLASGGTPPYTWSISSGILPAGLTLNASTGLISGTPTAEGVSSFIVQVTDSDTGVAAQSLGITVVLPPAATLNITLSADNASEVYVNGTLVGSTSDWKVAGVFTMPLQTGTNVVAIKGIDAGGVAGALAALSWGGNTAITDTSWKVSPVLESGWETVGFDDSGWALASSYGVYGVGPWLARVVGFPDPSSAQWIWTADNFNDDIAYLRYTITVGTAPLAIDTTTLADANAGEVYSQTVLASGGTPPYNWSITAGSLPTGLALNASTGVIAGTPTVEGASSFTVQVMDADAGVATQALGITVVQPPPATLNLTLSADNASEVYVNGVLVGSTSDWKAAGVFTVPLQAGTNVVAVKGIDAGGVAGVLAALSWGSSAAVTDTSWKVSAVLAPGWETVGFDDSAWVAATSYGVYGVTPWLDRVVGFPVSSPAKWVWTDDNFNDDTAYLRYTITVGTAPLAIETTTLPDANNGEVYSQTLLASGGTPPYTWSVVSGSLPVGLSLDSASGVISGTPTTEATSNFTVQVMDADTTVVTQNLSITVVPPSAATLNITLSTDNASEVYVNGVLVGSTSDWQAAGVFTVPLQAGTNVVAIKGIDAGGVAGLLAELDWGSGMAVTDASWKVSSVLASGWETVGFDDSSWVLASSYGVYGVGPWLERVVGFPTGSSAQWIWTDDNFNDDIAYLRYTIFVP